jgi:hypothetical protein
MRRDCSPGTGSVYRKDGPPLSREGCFLGQAAIVRIARATLPGYLGFDRFQAIASSSSMQKRGLESMSSASNPNCPTTLFTPTSGPDIAHPMVQLPSTESQPFTLLKNADGGYMMTFLNQMPAGSNAVRIYIASYQGGDSNPKATFSALLVQGFLQLPFGANDLRGGTSLWAGAWWDDGTYPNTPAGIASYFVAHPSGGIHHTVPIILG